MKEMTDHHLSGVTGGGDLPINASYHGPSEATIAAILALLSHPAPTHLSD